MHALLWKNIITIGSTLSHPKSDT